MSRFGAHFLSIILCCFLPVLLLFSISSISPPLCCRESITLWSSSVTFFFLLPDGLTLLPHHFLGLDHKINILDLEPLSGLCEFLVCLPLRLDIVVELSNLLPSSWASFHSPRPPSSSFSPSLGIFCWASSRHSVCCWWVS